MNEASSARGSDLDIAQIWMTLRRARYWILGSALLGGVAAAALAFALPTYYTAETVLLVSSNDSGNRLQDLAGIASRVGLGGLVADSGTDRKVEAIATLQSRVLTEKYIADNNLMPILFADRWDVQGGKWRGDAADWPTTWGATELFRTRIRAIAEDRRNGLVTLSIRWTDRTAAAKWANELVQQANSYLQQSALARSARNLDYLKAELQKGNTIEVRQSINNLIETEINRSMLARGNDQYAFRIIDPAVVPEQSPLKRQLMLIASGFLLAAGFAAILSLLLRAVSGWNNASAGK
jgi:uncharacterized protein involved in exopolysaccharide biosynthesis